MSALRYAASLLLLLLQATWPAAAGPSSAAVTSGAAREGQAAPVASPAPPVLPSVPPAHVDDAEYHVGAGDILEITVLGHSDLSRTATVQTTGTINLPLLNEVPVAGLSVAEVQRTVSRLLEKDFLVDPHVEVRVSEYQSQFVLVLGEVNSPGRKTLHGGSRLVDVLVDSGGFTPRASGEVAISRTEGTFEGGAKVIRVRLGGAFSVQDYVALELALRHQDVITALARSYVTVEGEVQHPGRYAIEGELTVTGAISTAGGLTRFGSNEVRLRQLDAATGKVTITKVDLSDVRKGKKPDPVVAPNDVISVPRRLF
ncbi:MAG TPA: polysaccharide biosynthesis/export family protein [Vicinamibacteria bacterium]|nr:polysaccharide biosynthesis/export family protein [Vicinamibacteria bacterium]